MDLRPDWTKPQYYVGTKLDLSTNVCVDKNINYAIDPSRYCNAAVCYGVLSDFYKISPYNIAIGYGLSELMIRIMQMFKYKGYRFTVLGNPTWEAVSVYQQFLNIKEGHGVAYIANPNGNDGSVLNVDQIIALSKQHKYLIVDEAYCDFAPKHSIIKYRPSNVIVLKTLSKSYASPGLRFGWCFADQAIIKSIQDIRPAQAMVGGVDKVLSDILDNISAHVDRMNNTKRIIESCYNHTPTNGNYVLLEPCKLTEQFITKPVGEYHRMALLDMVTYNEYIESTTSTNDPNR